MLRGMPSDAQMACNFLKTPLKIGVNLSGKQFAQPDLVEQMKKP